MSLSLVLFILLAAVSLTAALGVVTSRWPVHSALFLLVNFITLAMFYVTLDAQFLAAAQVIIYAGGIVILILFVVMLIGSEKIGQAEGHRLWTPYVGVALGVLMLATMLYTFASSLPGAQNAGTALEGGAPKVVGLALFTQYILPIEMAAVLLLVALIGALLLARQPKSDLGKIDAPIAKP